MRSHPRKSGKVEASLPQNSRLVNGESPHKTFSACQNACSAQFSLLRFLCFVSGGIAQLVER
jgi:hypothetical protein